MSEPLGLGVEEPENRHGAFPRLDEQQRARLRSLGKVRQVEAGEVLFHAGGTDYDFFVVESAAVAVVQGYGTENRVIAVHGEHRFLGELSLLTGSRAVLTAVVRDPGEVIQVPRDSLRLVAAEDEDLINLILRAYLARAQYRKLDVPELERYEGIGVYYAATQAEGELCFGDPVVIVGGGNSAGQAAMFLSRHAASCHLLIRGGDLGKSMSRYVVDEIESREQVHVVTHAEVAALKGQSGLEAIVVRDTRGLVHRRLAMR